MRELLFPDPGAEHNADVAAEGRYMVSRGPSLHVGPGSAIYIAKIQEYFFTFFLFRV